MQLANTILNQLGGAGKLKMFTGARNFIALENGVSFRIGNRKTNYVKIVLNSTDTYDVTFALLRGGKLVNVREFEGIYNDGLKELFERETGMYLSFEKGGGLGRDFIDLVHVYEKDGTLYGTGELVEVKGDKTVVRFDANTIKEFDSKRVKPISSKGGSMAKGGEVIWTDISKGTHLGSLKNWESYKNIHNQQSIGSFAHRYNGKYIGDYYLFALDDYDREFYSHLPLKANEMLFRTETERGKISKSNPLIKVNIKKGWIYFMSDDNDPNSDKDDKTPKFNSKTADVVYLSLNSDVQKYNQGLIPYEEIPSYAKGGSMAKGTNEAYVQINDYPYTATVRDLKSFAKHLESETEKFTLGVFGKITYISDDADKEWVEELKKLISAKQKELERVKKVSDKMDLDEAKRREKRNAPRRITKVEDAEDVGYKEYKDYYRVGEGSIGIDKNEVTGEYGVFDARSGYSTDYVDTLTEARKLLREYLNTEKVLILSEKKYYENVDEIEDMLEKKRHKDYADGGMTSHGLKKGDKIFAVSGKEGEILSVDNKPLWGRSEGIKRVNLKEGTRYAKGGEVKSKYFTGALSSLNW